MADRAFLFDNSDEMLLIAEKDDDALTVNIDAENFPNWFIEFVINKA